MVCEAQNMLTFAWETIPVFAGVFGGAVICLPLTRRFPIGHLLATTIYLSIDLEVLVHAPRLETLHWNWIGRILSLFLAFLAAWLFRLTPKEVGAVRLHGRDWFWLAAGCLIASLLNGTISYTYGNHNHNPVGLETLLYEATLPGIAEEVVYRGVSFAMIVRGYGGATHAFSNVAAVFISAFAFGSVHALSHTQAVWHSAWISFALAFLLGLWCGILRWRTSNVYVAALAHNAGNCAGLWAGNL